MSSRIGNFSSSEIYKLMSKGRGNWSLENVGAPFTTYVRDKVYESRLGRSLYQRQNSRITTWGTFVEKIVFDKLSLNYELVSKTRYTHPEIENWNGMPDVLTKDNTIVGDIKAPWTLLSFCQLVEAMAEGSEGLKKHSEQYYWQLVSNSILTGIDQAELIVYVPYKHELEEIKDAANNHSWDGSLSENDVQFINYASDEELPYLKKDGVYNNLNHLVFEVPQEDKDLLTARVKMAVAELKKQLR